MYGSVYKAVSVRKHAKNKATNLKVKNLTVFSTSRLCVYFMYTLTFCPAFVPVTQLRLKATGSHYWRSFVRRASSVHCVCTFSITVRVYLGASLLSAVCLCKSFCVRPVHQKTLTLWCPSFKTQRTLMLSVGLLALNITWSLRFVTIT